MLLLPTVAVLLLHETSAAAVAAAMAVAAVTREKTARPQGCSASPYMSCTLQGCLLPEDVLQYYSGEKNKAIRAGRRSFLGRRGRFPSLDLSLNSETCKC